MKVAKKEALMRAGSAVGVRFSFTGGGTYEIQVDQLTEEMKSAALIHGLLQKLGDAYANAKGDAKIAEGLFLPVYESIVAGEWNRKGERGASGLLILIEALARITGKDEGLIGDKVKAMGKDEIAALKKRPDVQKAIKEIELERAEKALEDSDEMDLGDLF